MSLGHGNKIVTDGLIFYIDMNNPKSNLGDTTTNIVSNSDFSSGITGWNAYGNTPTIVTTDTVPTTYGRNRNVLQYVSTNNSTLNGSFGGTSSTLSLSSGITYTVSMYARTLSTSTQMRFSHQDGAGSESNLSFNFTATNVWSRVWNSVTLNSSKSAIYIWTTGTAYTTFQIADIQIEAKSFPTAYTSTSRTTSTSIVDLVGLNTATNMNLSYSSDNSYTFGVFPAIRLPYNSFGYVSLTNFTYETWFYTTAFSGGLFNFTAIFGQSASPGNGLMEINFTGGNYRPVIVISTGSGSNQFLVQDSTTNIALNTWYNMTSTFDGSSLKIYINGIQTASGTTTWSPLQAGTPYYIGGTTTQSGGDLFTGYIPVVKVYNRALSAAEVWQNFNALRGRYGI